MSWKTILRVLHCDVASRCEVECCLERNDAGQTRQRARIVCKDGTFRPLHQTGFEGALQEACAQVKVNLVPVVTPVLDRRLNGSPESQRDDAMNRIRAMQQGTTLHPERREDGFTGYGEIGYQAATRRYGRQTTDVCERIPGGVGG